MFELNKHNIKLLLCCTLFIVLASCDPARVLIISNGNHKNSSVTVYASSNILPHPSTSDTGRVIIKMPSIYDASRNDTLLFYGLGNWSDEALMPGFAEQIDSIVFVSKGERRVLQDSQEITTCLLNCRRGLMDHVLLLKP